MPTLKNTTNGDIRLATGHLIPAFGELTIEARTLNHVDNLPVMGGQMRSGLLVLVDDVKPIYEEFSRQHVAQMNRTELTDCLKAHNAKANGTTDELRKRLGDVLFIDDIFTIADSEQE